VRFFLFDIEGTITSLAFVKDELSPYARRALPAFLRAERSRPEVAAIVERLAREVGVEPSDVDRVGQTLVQWIDEDRKQTDLKALQGMVWEDGYRTGAFRGHLYPDVLPFWKRARAAGLRLAIYSSGSEQAQRLLLTYSVEGDVSGLVDRYFDTRVGAKGERESYARIAGGLGIPPSEVRFFSDAVPELDAARAAGMATCRLLRPEVPAIAHDHPEVRSFEEVGVDAFAEA
jgi:enolase-phosphatase E1